MFCSYCGHGLSPGSRFCGACGKPIGQAPVSLIDDFIDDVVSVSLREIVLVDKITGSEILKSPVFRFLFFVAMGPLAIALLPTNDAILNGLAIYSAVLWALLLYRLFADRDLSFGWAIGTVLFTCFIMVPVLEIYLWLPPHITDFLTSHGPLPLRFVGFVLGVGVREELCKAAPLILLALFTPRMRRPLTGLVLGMMSGVGFAAAENVHYVYGTVSQAVSATAQTGEAGNLVVPVYNNVIRMTMGPFVHGSLSGVFGYFIGLAAVDRGRRVALFLAGLGLSSVLHGLYDTGVSTSPLFGLAIQAVTFFILMTYILKARGLTSAREIGGGVFSRTVMLRPAEGPRRAAEPPAATSVVALTEVAPDATTGAQPAPVAGGATASTWHLRGVAGPPAGRAYALSGEVRLGRDASRCAIHVDEVSVSREHAVLVPDVGRAAWLIRRLSRQQPLYVNGQQVEEAVLSPGDQIQVGSWVFVLEAA